MSRLTTALVLGLLVVAGAACKSDKKTGGASGSGAGTGAAAGTGSVDSGAAGTGSAGTSSAGTGSTADSGTAAAPSCAAYCTEVQANCTGNNQQYGSTDACNGICATFAPGTAADTSGATLGCHIYHGGAPAKSDPATHCPHAGPLGGGHCGTDCENFCTEAVAVCGSQASPPYTDKAACMTACGNFKGTDMVPYNAAATSGDSLACRMYHLSVASTGAAMAMTHCAHIAMTSPVCL